MRLREEEFAFVISPRNVAREFRGVNAGVEADGYFAAVRILESEIPIDGGRGLHFYRLTVKGAGLVLPFSYSSAGKCD